ncbi:MAG TPA: N4-gp56 family major capsid protein [Phycisphaerae bacterium]|nr:N4-gp56 family major capsid protein [Phycisphaerae bacterium]
MPPTEFSTAHPLREVKQSAAMWKYALSNTYFGKFIGPYEGPRNIGGPGIIISTSDNALVQVRMELAKGPGDKITFPIRVPLASAGVTGDDDLEGNEEAMAFLDFSIELFQIAHAVRGKGRLSDKRVVFDVRNQGRIALVEWQGRKIDLYTLCAMSGIASDDGNVAANAPSTNRKWTGGQDKAGVLYHTANNLDSEITSATNHLFGAKVIEAVKRKAQLATPKVRPIHVNGRDIYAMFLHPYQVKALKATTEWPDIQKSANVRGAKNPIFTGALGEWDGVVLHEWERLECRTGAVAQSGPTEYFDSSDILPNGITAARALFCGAQAAVQAYGALPRPLAKQFDYGRKWGVGIDCMLVVAKPEFGTEDYSVIVVDTAIVAD